MRKLVAVGSLLLLACGCAHYQTPGGGVSIPAITDSTIAEALKREPAAQFPAHVIAVRVQATGYESASGRGYGKGAFSVLTTRDIETEDDFVQLASLPGIAAVGPLNRILLPIDLRSAQELREAAAQLHGDIVLLYTVDTAFEKTRIITTCAAAFVDVRTGYVYGVAEGSAADTQPPSSWRTKAVDAARLKTERDAFSAALKEIAKTWTAINAEYGRTTASLR
jgi:hypothetical protein